MNRDGFELSQDSKEFWGAAVTIGGALAMAPIAFFIFDAKAQDLNEGNLWIYFYQALLPFSLGFTVGAQLPLQALIAGKYKPLGCVYRRKPMAILLLLALTGAFLVWILGGDQGWWLGVRSIWISMVGMLMGQLSVQLFVKLWLGR